MSKKGHDIKNISIPESDNKTKKYTIDELLELGKKENRIKLAETIEKNKDNKSEWSVVYGLIDKF